MESVLRSMLSDCRCELEVIDVDANPVLLERYDELVPVLLHDEKELCHYFIDDAKVRDLLREIG